MADTKTQISFEEVEELVRRRNEINAIPFDEIEWTRGGKPVEVTPEIADAWRFVGLSNVAFVEFYETGSLTTLAVS